MLIVGCSINQSVGKDANGSGLLFGIHSPKDLVVGVSQLHSFLDALGEAGGKQKGSGLGIAKDWFFVDRVELGVERGHGLRCESIAFPIDRHPCHAPERVFLVAVVCEVIGPLQAPFQANPQVRKAPVGFLVFLVGCLCSILGTGPSLVLYRVRSKVPSNQQQWVVWGAGEAMEDGKQDRPHTQNPRTSEVTQTLQILRRTRKDKKISYIAHGLVRNSTRYRESLDI